MQQHGHSDRFQAWASTLGRLATADQTSLRCRRAILSVTARGPAQLGLHYRGPFALGANPGDSRSPQAHSLAISSRPYLCSAPASSAKGGYLAARDASIATTRLMKLPCATKS